MAKRSKADKLAGDKKQKNSPKKDLLIVATVFTVCLVAYGLFLYVKNADCWLYCGLGLRENQAQGTISGLNFKRNEDCPSSNKLVLPNGESASVEKRVFHSANHPGLMGYDVDYDYLRKGARD